MQSPHLAFVADFFIASLGSNTVLIMTSSTRTSNLLQEYLSTRDESAPPGTQGRQMMERKLRLYLWWKGKLAERNQAGKKHFPMPDIDLEKEKNKDDGLSAAMKKKDREKQERSANRRRQRGGAGGGAVASSSTSTSWRSSQQPRRPDMLQGEEDMLDEAERMADL